MPIPLMDNMFNLVMWHKVLSFEMESCLLISIEKTSRRLIASGRLNKVKRYETGLFYQQHPFHHPESPCIQYRQINTAGQE